MCLQKLKRFTILLLILFSLPLIIGQLPFPNNKMATEQKEPTHLVLAAADVPEPEPIMEKPEPFNALLLFTHSHESYKPIVEKKTGLQAVYDEQTNIYSLQQMMEHYLQLNGVTPHFMDFDVMTEMQLTNKKLPQAYKVVRPVLADYLQQADYQLVIDFHRDAVKKKATTLTYGEETYAKLAFVVGAEHAGYEANLAYANALSEQLNGIVPGISRGIMKQQGDHVNGIYNQDLAPNMLLIEFGGIDNTEEELQRTMAVLAQAIRLAFVESIV